MIYKKLLLLLLLPLFAVSTALGLTAGFTATPASGCAPLVVTFHNTTTPSTGTTYSWTFGTSGSSVLTDPSASFTTPGTHLVTLTATNGTTVSTFTMTITVYPPPVVNFTADDTAVCPGTPITFTSTSTGSVPGPMTYSWNWGDGSPTGTGATATHNYSLPGYYTVTLFVTNASGCVASLVRSAYVHIYTPPVANFTWAPFGICNPPGSIAFSSLSSGTPPLTYSWTFGDGGTGTGASPSHPYTTVGSYNVRLIVVDANGCSDTITNGPITVDTIRAAFTYPTTACVFSYVIFPNTSSAHTTRTWNYGDGSPTTSLLNGGHVYSSPGTYTVTLTISNPPCTSTITHVVNVVTGPASDFIITPTDPCPAPATIAYTGTGPAGTTYAWFTESGPASGNPVTRTYGANGTKTVMMIATDPVTGCKDTVIKTHTIHDLIFKATASTLKGCVPLTVTFGADAITTIGTAGTYPFPLTSFIWYYGDGSATGSGPAPVHTFTAVGIYKVVVTAVTSNGCPVSDTLQIQVGAPPQVTFVASPLHVCYGTHTSIVFTPTIIVGPVDEYEWYFGDDGLTVTDTTTPPNAVSHTYSLPGLFTVTVTPFYRGCRGPDYIRTDYVLVDSPKSIIDFKLQCTPRTAVQFGDSSLGDDTHVWMFGDGTTSTVDNPLHIYPTVAVYTVKLATYNINSGCRDTATLVLDLFPPIVSFVADDTTVCKNDTVVFFSSVIGTVSEYTWYVDGFIPTMDTSVLTPILVHVFPTTGYHSIGLRYRDNFGCLDSVSRLNYVLVGRPVSGFTGSPVSGCRPLTVTFTDGSTPAVGTTVSSYAWSFGDGATSTITSPSVSHIYTAAGVYTVTEVATDNIGCKDTVVRPAYITVYQPVASFNASNLHPCLGAPATFTNTSTGGIVSSFWDFGDGNTSTVTSPVHTYTALGTFTVKLTVTDANGCTDVATYVGYIGVTKPVANFTMSDSVSVCPPLFVNFTNTTTGAVSYFWSLGDATTAVVPSPSNMYITSGLFNVQLIATNLYGCKDTVMHPVNIFGYAGAFTYSPLQGCVPLAVHFTASLSNVPFITWDFSDGVTSSISYTDTFTHIYTTPGAYVPKLLLSDNTGCQTSSTGLDTIKVDAIYTKFTTEPNPVCIGAEFTFIDSSTTYWSPITTWEWTYDGNTSMLPAPVYSINTPGTYPVTLKVENGWGCIGIVTRNVVVSPPPDVTASADTVVCVGDPATLSGYGAVTYTWAAPATLSCTACNPTYATPAVVTTYTVTGKDANGCIDSATVTVGLRTHTISRAWGDTAVCQGESVQLFDTGGTSYQWIPSTGLNSSIIFNPIATAPYTIIYTVIARLAGCIPDTNQVTVVIWPRPTVDAGPDQRILAGNTAQLNATGTDIATYKWWPGETLSCTDCYNPVASMTVNTTYNIDVVSDRGCKASDSVRILLYCDNSMVFIPNSFTPNNDGQNDVFYPRGRGLKTIKTFRIYNRWGELLYDRSGIDLNDASVGWDGTYKGATPKPDVYVYILEAVCFTGEDIHMKGDVTILR